MLTHDHSSNRIGDNVTVSGAEVYYMHLPVDVLKGVAASDIANSPFGGSPQYLSGNTLLDFLVAVVTLPYALAICTLNFVASVTSFVVSIGLQALGSIVAAISGAVSAAETAVVNAFNAFVAWAASVIVSAVQTLLQPVIASFRSSFGVAFGEISANVHSTTLFDNFNASAAKNALSNLSNSIVNGLLTKLAIAAAVMIKLVILTLYAMTMGAAFLIQILISTACSVLLTGIFGSVTLNTWGGGTIEFDSTDIMESTGVTPNEPLNWLDAICCTISFAVGSYGIIVGSLWGDSITGIGIMGITIGILAAIYAIGSMIESRDDIAWLGLAFGVFAMFITTLDYILGDTQDTTQYGLAMGLDLIAIGVGSIPLAS